MTPRTSQDREQSRRHPVLAACKCWAGRRFGDRGEMVVEIAVIFPIFLFMLLLVVQYAMYYLADQGATAGAQAGAQALSQGLPAWQTTALVAANNEVSNPAVSEFTLCHGSTTPPGLSAVTVTGFAPEIFPFVPHFTVCSTAYFARAPTAKAGA